MKNVCILPVNIIVFTSSPKVNFLYIVILGRYLWCLLSTSSEKCVLKKFCLSGVALSYPVSDHVSQLVGIVVLLTSTLAQRLPVARETHEPAPVGLQKSSLSLTPFHQQRWNTNWFHLRPQRAQIKVCEAWLHRACTIHTWNPQRVSVISVRCKTIMTPFHHSTGCSSVIGGVSHNYQTHTDINIIHWAQLLIQNQVNTLIFSH